MQARLQSYLPSWRRLTCARGTECILFTCYGEVHVTLKFKRSTVSCAGSVALFNLEEYESAKDAFETANSVQKKKETETWIRKCNAELEGLISWNTRSKVVCCASLEYP